MRESFGIMMSVIAWLITTILMWFLVSFLFWIATDLTYKQALTTEYQILFALFVYWWLPSAFVAVSVREYYD